MMLSKIADLEEWVVHLKGEYDGKTYDFKVTLPCACDFFWNTFGTEDGVEIHCILCELFAVEVEAFGQTWTEQVRGSNYFDILHLWNGYTEASVEEREVICYLLKQGIANNFYKAIYFDTTLPVKMYPSMTLEGVANKIVQSEILDYVDEVYHKYITIDYHGIYRNLKESNYIELPHSVIHIYR